MITDWLPGWKLLSLEAPGGLYSFFKKECDFIIGACKTLSDIGVMPEIPGRRGRAGNIVVKIRLFEASWFIGTGTKTNKANMSENSLVFVSPIDWEGKTICSFQHKSIGLKNGIVLAPTTESLLAAWAGFPVSIHFHNQLSEKLITPKCMIKVRHPAAEESDWEEMRSLTQLGHREIGLRGHTDPKGPDKDTLDAAFVFGTDPEETLERAIRLIKQSPLADG